MSPSDPRLPKSTDSIPDAPPVGHEEDGLARAETSQPANAPSEIPPPVVAPRPPTFRPRRKKSIVRKAPSQPPLTEGPGPNVPRKRAKPRKAAVLAAVLVPVSNRPRKKSKPSHAPERLRTGTRRTLKVHKAGQIKLSPSISIDGAMAKILGACRDHWEKNIQPARKPVQADALHQVRVGLRRFRTAVTLFRDFIPVVHREAFIAEVRVLNAALGPARDLDDFIHDLEDFAKKRRETKAAADLLSLKLAAKRARVRASRAVAAALTSRRYRRFMDRLDAWLSDRRWLVGKRKAKDGGKPAADYARSLLNRRLSKIRKQAKDIKKFHAEELHELRITIKKVRYALEFFESLLPSAHVRRTKRQLASLQDSLGRLNDFEVVKGTVNTLIDSVTKPAHKDAIRSAGREVSAHLRSLAKSNRPKAIQAGARLRSEKSFR